MTTVDQPQSVSGRGIVHKGDARPAGGVRFDLLVAAVGLVFTFGLFLDGWAHNHGRVDDSFFTPWHAVFYSGYLIAGLVLVVTHFRNVQQGYRWTKALPTGYMLPLVGLMIFGVGGVGDMLWHETFGIEEDLEALLSPTHLTLATGMVIFMSGPIMAAWKRTGEQHNWRNLLPVVIAMTSALSILTFLSQYLHFYTSPYSMTGFKPRQTSWLLDMLGIAWIIVPVALMMGMVLFALRRWRLPFGAVTIIFTTHMFLMMWMRFRSWEDALLVLPILVGGLLADILIWRLTPSLDNADALRLLAFLVPFVIALGYMIALNALEPRGLWWEIHMWLGAPFVAGIVGLLLSVLAAPPTVPDEA